VTVAIVYETHSTTADNEAGIATGWNPTPLTALGRAQAAELGERRRDNGLAAVFASDLARARETAEIAFGDGSVLIFLDWRLRECDYGGLNGASAATVHDQRLDRITTPHPNGESWSQAVDRVTAALDDIAARFDGQRVLVIGHIATRWALFHHVEGRSLEDLATAEFEWQEGWEFAYKSRP
jgi:2,3-bisphosphoglycerate-dependent phosphoglycerate mutase